MTIEDPLVSRRHAQIAVDGDEVPRDGGASVERAPEAVENAPEERGAGADLEGSAGGFDVVVGADAGEGAEGHRDGFAAVEADDFARQGIPAPLHGDHVADANPGKREP